MARGSLLQNRNPCKMQLRQAFADESEQVPSIDEKTGGLTPRGKKIINGTPMERYCVPEELTERSFTLFQIYLSSLPGVVIPVDGGFSAYTGV